MPNPVQINSIKGFFMTKRISHKFRICRQIGEDIWGTQPSKKYKLERSPGELGKLHRKAKDTRYEPKYLTQLKEKQKLKKYYGDITESQFFSTFEKGMGLKGEVFQNVFSLLERRLDAVVFRMGFVTSIFEARQYINHGHISVNGKIVTIASYHVENFDHIKINNSIRSRIQESLKKRNMTRDIPSYLEIDIPLMQGVFLRTPQTHEIPYNAIMNMRAVIEYYSR